MSKEGHRLELLRTYGSFKGFSVLLISEDPDVAQLVTSYVLTLKVNEDGKLQATQANIVDFTLEELMEIQNLIVEVINSN